MKDEIVGEVKIYRNGTQLVRFIWDGKSGYAWNESEQFRIAEYRTKKDIEAAFFASDNTDGAYGCARLYL